MVKQKLLYFVTEDWYFISHRLPLAVAAQEQGYEVAVLTRCIDSCRIIEEAGLRVIPLTLQRSGRSLWRELREIGRLYRLYRRERPDIVHQVAMKPVIYGTVAARMQPGVRLINAIAGFGYVFTGSDFRARVLRRIFSAMFRWLFNSRRVAVIVQNPDDATQLTEGCRVSPERVNLIRGSGVDTEQFYPVAEPDGPVRILLPARMLWDKGVGEFVTAAKELRKKGIEAQFLLAGERDAANPASISESQLRQWQKSGVVDWLGRCEQMPDLLRSVHIVCLPSYREGLPKALLEAAACAKPLVTTDVPGCREVVKEGENGFLVPPRDSAALVDALQQLIFDPGLRQRMGKQSRDMVERDFALDRVINETLELYRRALA